MGNNGSEGEKRAQARFGTSEQAGLFYGRQMLSCLNARMVSFLETIEMVFISTADTAGNCDCSLRAGPPGFVIALDDKTLAIPEYRGNGVMASVGNILENPHVGMFFVDFKRDKIGLHVNGGAEIVDNDIMASHPQKTDAMANAIKAVGGRRPTCWIVVEVDEAYIHCSKHIPLLQEVSGEIPWGTDDEEAKGGDFFGAAAQRKK